jgi:hypothetical protein
VAKEDDMIKDDEQREKCRRILLAIETEGGPKKASSELIKEAEDLKMVVRGKARWNYSLKANVLRREMMQEVAKGGQAIVALLKDAKPSEQATPSPNAVGKIVDAQVCGLIVRARVKGLVRWYGPTSPVIATATPDDSPVLKEGLDILDLAKRLDAAETNGLDLVVLEHWRAGAWETLAVPAASLKEVTKIEL